VPQEYERKYEDEQREHGVTHAQLEAVQEREKRAKLKVCSEILAGRATCSVILNLAVDRCRSTLTRTSQTSPLFVETVHQHVVSGEHAKTGIDWCIGAA
jgi:hypothetical protein